MLLTAKGETNRNLDKVVHRLMNCHRELGACLTADCLSDRLEEAEMLLAAKGEINRNLDKDVHRLMGQLEDLNRRYAVLGRRTATLQVSDHRKKNVWCFQSLVGKSGGQTDRLWVPQL